MGIFNFFGAANKPSSEKHEVGAISYGKQKKNGGHDHRRNKDKDRTPAQRDGDAKRRKSP